MSCGSSAPSSSPESDLPASRRAENGALRALYLRASPFPHPELEYEADLSQKRFEEHQKQRRLSCQVNPMRRDAQGRFVGCDNILQDLTNVPQVDYGRGERRVRVAVFPPYEAPVRPPVGFFDQAASQCASFSSYKS